MKILRITFFSFIVGVFLSIILFMISPMNDEFHVSAINIASAIYLYSIITVIILVIQAILLFIIKASDKISFCYHQFFIR
ncbi:putative integral membrane protein [Chryseobacterium ginsenosidimutans]|nr:putative integral membrane protein [Chryseobacterium ginsenosidimutans]